MSLSFNKEEVEFDETFIRAGGREPDMRTGVRLSVRGTVTENHSANVNAFLALKIIQFRIKLLHKVPAKQ